MRTLTLKLIRLRVASPRPALAAAAAAAEPGGRDAEVARNRGVSPIKKRRPSREIYNAEIRQNPHLVHRADFITRRLPGVMRVSRLPSS